MSVRPEPRYDNAGLALVFAALLCTALVVPATGAPADVAPGIDTWARQRFAPLTHRRIGLITNVTGRSASGTATLRVLADSPDIELVRLFSTEHGLGASLEGDVEHGLHEATGLPVYSLYGEHRRPTAEMLAGLEALVFDIQDVGTRFYTYGTTMAYAMEEAARHGVEFVVLDRPNPIGGVAVSGPVADESLRSFVSYAAIPTRHGMTLGELASYYNDELGIGASLTVVAVDGWQRQQWYDETGLAWVNPSPNIRNLTQALLYPAVGPLETTNLSVGRGTDAPFEWIGAPWIGGRALAAALNGAALPGVRFLPRQLTPAAGPYSGQECDGVNLLVTDRDAFDAGRTSAALAVWLWRLHGDHWNIDSLPRQWGDPGIVRQLHDDWDVDRIVASWQPRLQEFLRARQRHLRYR